MKTQLTQISLKEWLYYSPTTGIFTWLIRDPIFYTTLAAAKSRNTRFAGLPAGYNHKTHSGKTYITIEIMNAPYQAHRLAYLYMLGRWPIDQIDHADGNGLNNIWSNLSDATSLDNARNQRLRKDNTSSHSGVTYKVKQNLWVARIGVNKKRIHLGYFQNLLAAITARNAANILYNFHPNHGQERLL